MKVLDRINNVVGSFLTAWAKPTTGASTATLTAVLPAAELTDPTNTLQLDVEADFGAGFRWMASGACWTGGPGQTAPALAWQFSPAHPPKRVRGVLHNLTQVVVTELDLTFA